MSFKWPKGHARGAMSFMASLPSILSKDPHEQQEIQSFLECVAMKTDLDMMHMAETPKSLTKEGIKQLLEFVPPPVTKAGETPIGGDERETPEEEPYEEHGDGSTGGSAAFVGIVTAPQTFDLTSDNTHTMFEFTAQVDQPGGDASFLDGDTYMLIPTGYGGVYQITIQWEAEFGTSTGGE